MPQDPDLYGQRPPKKQKRDGGSAGSLDFTAQMTALISNHPTSSSAAPRSRRRGEQKETVFRPSGKGTRKHHDEPRANSGRGLRLKEGQATQEEVAELERSRRKMEEKARIYSALKRGDYVPKENEPTPLVDFDRKWAEANDGDARNDESSDSAEDDGDDDDEIIEFEDQYGRTRQGTRAEKDRMDRQRKRGLMGAEELERMSARPAAPQSLIYGDAIQTMAFNPDDADKMEELARKRDRSQTPPDMKHYDADGEIRDKGVGFYKFSKDGETRRREMESLKEERQATEARHREREEKKAARQKEIQERRGTIEARRAKKMADSFLDVLAGDL